MADQPKSQSEIDSYLSMIRKTIADSERLVSQAELRIAETDRMLAQQGLTREQVMAMNFSPSQIDAANAELKRLGFEPVELEEEADMRRETIDASRISSLASDSASGSELAERQRKFGMMMKPFHI